MDPYDERRLIEEVIYLHSLWRQGPPRNPNPNPNPRPNFNNPSTILHQPSISTPFKNINAKKKKNKKKKKIMANHENPSENSDILWQQTVVAESPISASGWPAFKPSSCPAVKKPLSAEDEAKSLANKMQQKGLEASSNFFSRNCCLDDDEDEYEDSDYDDDIDMDDCEECEEYKFFLNMFKEENDLRNYYEKNYEAGDFFCLVCCGIGKKVWKRYKNCVAVIQHSVAIANTKKKIAHRAYGQVICKVLGWDINRLQTIVLSSSDTLTQSLAKHGDSQVVPNENHDDGKNNLGNQDGDINFIQEKELGDDCSNELMVCENALKEGDSITLEEDSVKVMSDVGSNTKGLLNYSEMLVEDGAEGAQIKMDNIEKNKKKKKKIMANHENPSENSDILWQQTVLAESPISASGWPAFKPSSCSAVKKPLSAEDEAKSLANKMQQKGLEASSNFFSRNCCLDDDEDKYEDSDDDDDDDIDMDDCEECEEYKFFLNMFKEENDLRNYYVKNYEAGDFFCLVCCGIGKKVWKRYKNCVAVIQHSVAIANTKKKIAHRAYGQVICKVLGWDINRLPTIVLSSSDTLTQSLAKHGDSQVVPNENHDDGKNNLGNQDGDINFIQERELGYDCSNELMVCENALKEGDSITLEEDSVKVMSDVGSNTKGLLNCSEMLVEDGAEGAQIKMDNIEEEILVDDDLKGDGVAKNGELLDEEVAEATK